LKCDKCIVESENTTETDQGWAAWAWSFVPQLTSPDGDSPELTELDSQQSMKKVEQSVFDVGIYIMQASVVFKVRMFTWAVHFYTLLLNVGMSDICQVLTV